MHLVFFVWLLFFVSCSSIVSFCSAWRLKHRRMATHNERLHSLSSTKGNLLRITFHDSMIPLSSFFFFFHHSDQNRISRSGRLPHRQFHCVCVFVCTQGDLGEQTQYDDGINTSPLVRNAVSASAWADMGGKCCHMVFSSRGSLLMSPMPIWLLSGISDWWGGGESFWYFWWYYFTINSSPYSFTQVKAS